MGASSRNLVRISIWNNNNMKNHVVTKETAILLREAGFPQESFFKWIECSALDGKYNLVWDEKEIKAHEGFDIVSAPIAEEILKELPQILEYKGTIYQLFISMGLDRHYFIFYADERDYNNNAEMPIIMRHNLTETIARMWLYLKQNNT